jgi:hypothetical protein
LLLQCCCAGHRCFIAKGMCCTCNRHTDIIKVVVPSCWLLGCWLWYSIQQSAQVQGGLV